MSDPRMSAQEALARLAGACGDHAVDDSSSWEIEALKRSGWTAAMILGDENVTIVLTPPKK